MIAVITGDLVKSSKLSSTDYTTALDALKSTFADANAELSAAAEIFRGDSFQLRLDEPECSLRYALLLRLSLFSIANCKVTMAIGLGESLVNNAQPGNSLGEAYELSGRGLDASQSGSMTLHTNDVNLRDTLSLPTRMLDFMLSSITRKQAGMLYDYIRYKFPEHQKIADLAGTSRQNVSKQLSRAGADLIKDTLLFYSRQVANARTR